MIAATQPRTCVVISYWVARPPQALFRLLRQARKIDPGAPIDIVVVCNGGDQAPLALPPEFADRSIRVIPRENTGWNLGAWDAGWRAATGYEFYLFLQDDCVLKRPRWVGEFEFRAENDAGVGLLGETLMWDRMTWAYIRRATDRDLGRFAWPEAEPVHPLDTYQRLLTEHGVAIGEVGTHLPAIILFAPRAVLEEVGGFPLIGSTYREAVACEIGISRRVEAHGYRVAKIAGADFQFIGHPQWGGDHAGRLLSQAKVRAILRRLGGRRLKRMLTGR